MRIDGVIWLRHVVDKLASKHLVTPDEVEQTLTNEPRIRFMEKGERKLEDVYLALGKPMRVVTFQFSSFTSGREKR